MRISDWSSDVCSSDLLDAGQVAPADRTAERPGGAEAGRVDLYGRGAAQRGADEVDGEQHRQRAEHRSQPRHHRHRRSDEHTSEVQSLMRITYAVFCLTKKKTRPTNQQ